MHSREFVAQKLREASHTIQGLSEENQSLIAQNNELLEKVAELQGRVSHQDSTAGHSIEVGDTFPVNQLDGEAPIDTAETIGLQKEAGFSFRDHPRPGFGEPSDENIFKSNLSVEEKMELILNGESTTDY